MMKLSIYRCANCNKIRLVDKVNDEWICFACKQNVKKKNIVIKETPIEVPVATKTSKAKKKRK